MHEPISDADDLGPWATSNEAIEEFEEAAQDSHLIETKVVDGTVAGEPGATVVKVTRLPGGGRRTEITTIKGAAGPKVRSALKTRIKGKHGTGC